MRSRIVTSGALGAIMLVAGALTLVGACTSGGNPASSNADGGLVPNADGGYTVTSCPNGSGVLAPACAACLNTSCATELASVNAACAAVLSCACPVGVDALACTPSAACSSAANSAVAACASCASACGGGSGGGGGDAGASTLFVPDDLGGKVYRYTLGPNADPVALPAISLPSAVSVAFSSTGAMFVDDHASGSVTSFLSPLATTPTAGGTLGVNVGSQAEAMTFVDDELWVAGFASASVVRIAFDASGTASSPGNVKVSECEGLLWDPAIRVLYVSQAYSSGVTIQPFSVAADHTTTALTPISAPNVYGMILTPWGELLATNALGDSLSRFTLDAQGGATPNGTITGNGMADPIGLAFTPWGELYVGNQGTGSVSRFTFDSSHAAVANGTFQTQSGAAPNGAGSTSRMDWIAIH